MSAITTVLRRPRALVPVPRAPRLELVREPERSHVLVHALATVVTLAASVFGAVALNATAADAAVGAHALETRIAEAEQRHAELIVEVATLEDPARIRELALGMGLVPGGPARHVELLRALPADGASEATALDAAVTDDLKPILSVQP